MLSRDAERLVHIEPDPVTAAFLACVIAARGFRTSSGSIMTGGWNVTTYLLPRKVIPSGVVRIGGAGQRYPLPDGRFPAIHIADPAAVPIAAEELRKWDTDTILLYSPIQFLKITCSLLSQFIKSADIDTNNDRRFFVPPNAPDIGVTIDYGIDAPQFRVGTIHSIVAGIADEWGPGGVAAYIAGFLGREEEDPVSSFFCFYDPDKDVFMQGRYIPKMVERTFPKKIPYGTRRVFLPLMSEKDRIFDLHGRSIMLACRAVEGTQTPWFYTALIDPNGYRDVVLVPSGRRLVWQPVPNWLPHWTVGVDPELVGVFRDLNNALTRTTNQKSG